MGITLSTLRGSKGCAGSVGGKTKGGKIRVFTQISLGLFNMWSPSLHDKREKLFHGVSWIVRALKALEDGICCRKRVWSRIVGLVPSQILYFYNLLRLNALFGTREDSIMKKAWCKHPLWGNRDISGCGISGHHGPDTSYDPGDTKEKTFWWHGTA